MVKSPPTPDDVLKEFQRYVDAHRRSPAQEELAKTFKVSIHKIHNRLHSLRKAGLLAGEPDVHRGLRLTTLRARTEDKVRTFFSLIDANVPLDSAAQRAELSIETAACLLRELRG